MIGKLTKWAFKAKIGQAYNFAKTIIFLRVVNTLIKGLKEFAIPVLSIYIDYLIEMMMVLTNQDQSNAN